ncbi:phosphoglycerate kinase [Mesorhizobium sp. A623]
MEDAPFLLFALSYFASEIHYWRKHLNLYGWMHDLNRRKGGTNPEFNCDNLHLAEADLVLLENGALPQTSGFFSRETDGSEIADDLLFVAFARDAFAAVLTVFYTSWR